MTPTNDANVGLAASIGEAAGLGGGDHDEIRVEVDGAGTLTLFGNVRSVESYGAAVAAARAVPGVQNVRQQLMVSA